MYILVCERREAVSIKGQARKACVDPWLGGRNTMKEAERQAEPQEKEAKNNQTRVSNQRKPSYQRTRRLDIITADPNQGTEKLKGAVQEWKMWRNLTHKISKSGT